MNQKNPNRWNNLESLIITESKKFCIKIDGFIQMRIVNKTYINYTFIITLLFRRDRIKFNETTWCFQSQGKMLIIEIESASVTDEWWM